MQTIKKVILVVICLVVLLTSFIQPAVALEPKLTFDDLPGIELPDTPFQDMLDIMDPYAPMLMIDQTQNWLGDASKQDGFEFTEAVLNSKDFLYYEYLPYGTNTLVLGFRNKSNTALYLVFLDAYAVNIIVQTWNKNNGRCGFEILSTSPIFRMGFALQTGEFISFNGAYGLTDKGITVSSDGESSYYFGYTLTANDYYFVTTDNIYSNTGFGIRYIDDTYVADSVRGIDFDTDVYPTVTQREQELQNQQNNLIEEGNKTSKGIWDSIKELPSKIADSISGLFDKLINYLLYFQETKPDHVNPFADILTDVKSFFNDQMSDVGDFKNSLSSTLNNVVTYIETGSGVVNTFLTAVPMLSAFITFFVVFCIVRKVIGR